MNKSQAILLKLLDNELFDRKYSVPKLSDNEWKNVFHEAQQQAVSRIAYNSAVKCGLPESIKAEWQLDSLKNLKNNLIVQNNHLVLNKWLRDTNIPYVVLKGCSSAYYYPEPIERAMGDVDFLVRKCDVEKAGRVLEEHGLKPWDVDHICHIVYRAPKQHFEMHFDLSGVPYGKPGDLVHQYIEDIFDKSFVYNTDDGQMCLPSKFHHGLIILLHTSHHMTGEGIGLRHLCDWAVFLDSCSDTEFKELFEHKFKSIGMWKFASVLSRICIKYLGCEPKNCLMNVDDELSKRLIDDILFGGNFGKKDSFSRQYQARMISDRGKSGMNKKSMIGYFITSVNDSVKNHWRITRKYPFIIPFGWIYFGSFKIADYLKNRKKANVKQIVDSASKRKNIYSQLEIFDVQN